MPRQPRKKSITPKPHLQWSPQTELVGLELELLAPKDFYLVPQYTVGLHARFLKQVQQSDPELSAYLHDGESEKAFTISALDGKITSSGRQLQLSANTTYRWYVTALSHRVQAWLAQWANNLPDVLDLHDTPLQIRDRNIIHPPTTYAELLNCQQDKTIALQFLTPTSFRRKSHHFPLPVPTNIFHSYLRRWNDFSGMNVNQDDFLDWVDNCVIVNRCQITTVKVTAGKRGSVTGFTGAVELSLTNAAQKNPEYYQLFYALGKLAPYCGT